jgi:hypothetical protein
VIIVHYFPIYWGFETEAPDRSLITRSTLDEILPPFRKSIWAFRIRVSRKRWLHIGWFEYDNIDSHWGLSTPVEEIAQWRGPHAFQQEEGDADPTPDEVRQVERQ